MPVRLGQTANIQTETARDRGADLILVQVFAFDLAGFEHIFGQCGEDGFLAQVKAQRIHPPDETSLTAAHRRQTGRKRSGVPCKGRPVVALMDICGHSPHSLR